MKNATDVKIVGKNSTLSKKIMIKMTRLGCISADQQDEDQQATHQPKN
jgi:hypothetical protein